MVSDLMVIRISKLIIGCLVLYILGWLNHRKPEIGTDAPKIVAFLCGKKSAYLNQTGMIAQWLSLGYFAGAISAVLLKKSELMSIIGFSSMMLSLIILGLIWLIWMVTRKRKK